MNTSHSKQQIRQELRQQRRALSSAQRNAYEQQALDVFIETIRPDLFPMAMYLAFDGELDPKAMIAYCWDNKYSIYLPVVIAGQRELNFALYTPETTLVANQYGILQPSVENSVRVDTLQSLLMPLTAYDQTGARLGMGGGYYDRTLASGSYKPHLIGLAFTFQEVTSCPSEEHDKKLDAILTNDGYTVFK